jgi:hypothetical protein
VGRRVRPPSVKSARGEVVGLRAERLDHGRYVLTVRVHPSQLSAAGHGSRRRGPAARPSPAGDALHATPAATAVAPASAEEQQEHDDDEENGEHGFDRPFG